MLPVGVATERAVAAQASSQGCSAMEPAPASRSCPGSPAVISASLRASGSLVRPSESHRRRRLILYRAHTVICRGLERLGRVLGAAIPVM